jgi:energy-converting hydrogenase Eha subunit F
METLISFIWGVLVALGIVAVMGLLVGLVWHIWQHYHQQVQPQPQQPQQQTPPQYVEGLDRGGGIVIEAIERALNRIQNPKKIEMGSFIIDARNDNTRVVGPRIKTEV